jgi:hypothetical protein
VARQSAFSITLGFDNVLNLAQSLGSFTSEELSEVARVAVNEAAEGAYVSARKTLLRGINLTETYVIDRMEFRPAKAGKIPVAEIVAPVGRKYLTNLSHYGAMQAPTGVNWTNEKIQREIIDEGKGRWAKSRNEQAPYVWHRRDGDDKRGIVAGKKADKMTVEVVRGSRKSAGTKFTMPGKTDREGNQLVFRRDGKKVTALTGPSVYQLFRNAIPRIEDDVGTDLERRVIEAAERALTEALE